MAVFENRSGAYFMYVSSGSAENRHLQAAMATFGSGSNGCANHHDRNLCIGPDSVLYTMKI